MKDIVKGMCLIKLLFQKYSYYFIFKLCIFLCKVSIIVFVHPQGKGTKLCLWCLGSSFYRLHCIGTVCPYRDKCRFLGAIYSYLWNYRILYIYYTRPSIYFSYGYTKVVHSFPLIKMNRKEPFLLKLISNISNFVI